MITIKNTRNRDVDQFKSFEEFKSYVLGGYDYMLTDASSDAEYDAIIDVINDILLAHDIVDVNEAIKGIEDYSGMYEEV